MVIYRGASPDRPDGSPPLLSSADLPLTRAQEEGVVRMREQESMKSTFEEAVNKEKRMLKRELKRVKISEHKMKVLESVIENVAFMKVKLDEQRENLEQEDAVVEYDNGGGQKGVRESPFFKSYEALWTAYMKGMDRIMNSIPDAKLPSEEKNRAEKPETVLELIEARRRKEA